MEVELPVEATPAFTPLPYVLGDGCYLARCSSVPCALRWAASLASVLAPLEAQPAAVVLDVDGTILKSGPTKTVCHRGLHTLATHCAALGLAIIIVTARQDGPGAEPQTAKQLAQCGIVAETLYMRREKRCPRAMKAAARADVAKTHGVLLTVGDQWFDVTDAPIPSELLDTAVYVGNTAEAWFVKLPSEFA